MSSNELARATSPYLLQHRDNPVHWLEWGPAALARAKAENKPILLSIGYAACHWCHVMARESFEDDATASVMNDLFVNIKVDREERPDVDHLYMTALQALGEQGGWPLTMFLTPDAEPFWGGTYFPKDGRYGRPSFTSVLRSVSAAYHEQPDRIARNTTALMQAVSATPASESGELTPDALSEATRQLASTIDRHHGGMGGAPKFPNSPAIEMLIRGGLRDPSGQDLELAILTLAHICEGGIYDHLGGGFARYSTDERWLVPHFEKMLYDNAQLLELLAVAHRLTDHPLFRQRAEETVTWLDREMTGPDGTFFSSLDADSDHVEGRFYIWTAAELQDVLGPEEAAFFARFYDVTPGGNWHDEETGEPVTILNRLRAPAPSADEAAVLADQRARLLARRETRTRPGLDDKILCDWNALAITALVQAGTLLDQPGWVDRAARAFASLVRAGEQAFGPGRLVHAQRQGQLGPTAFASDYVGMVRAALALHEVKLEAGTPYLELARGWVAHLREHFADESGRLYMTDAAGSDIPARLAPLYDEATPNPNGLYIGVLVRMAAFTGEDSYRDEADRVLQACQGAVLSHRLAHASLYNGFDTRLNAREIVLAGADTAALRQAALSFPWLDRIVVEASSLPADGVRAAQVRAAGSGAAFVCQGATCSAPVRDAEALRTAMGGG